MTTGYDGPLFPVPVGENDGTPGDYPISTWVMIDGTRVPCTANDLADGTPTILDGLSFSWGRDTYVDQPDANTCAFTLREQTDPDAVTITEVVHVGSRIEVWSSAEVPVIDAEVMRYPGFSGATVSDDRWMVADGTDPDTPVEVSTFYGDGEPTAWFIHRDVFEPWSAAVIFGPGRFVAEAGTNPNAWDLIPRLLPGDEWTVTVTGWVPPGTTVSLVGWAMTGPHKTDIGDECTITGDALTATGTVDELTGTPGWFTLTGKVALPATFTDPAGAWVAPGIRFDELPSPTTWDEAPGNWEDATLRWIDLQRVGVSTVSMLQADASVRTVLIWAGEVTSAVLQPAGDHAVTAAITASDLSSVLANVNVGDEPWPVQTVADRAATIMALIPTSPPLIIDPDLQTTLVSYRDVDKQPPLGLLQDLAATAGGVLWITAHATQGAYLWMEDPRRRDAVRQFAIDDEGAVYITDGTDVLDGVAALSAQDVLRDPITWTQSVAQVITQASVGWLEQIAGGEGEQDSTEDHTEVVQDTAERIDRFGIRDLSVGTELTTAADAEALAARLLAASEGAGWIVTGMQLDTILLRHDIDTVDYATRLTVALDLLDATIRIGYAFTLIDLPEWTPEGAVRSMYVEGGTYTWADHRWQLEMTATPSPGQGVSATWDDFAGTGVTWDDFRINRIKWLDAYGTAGPTVEAERVSDG